MPQYSLVPLLLAQIHLHVLTNMLCMLLQKGDTALLYAALKGHCDIVDELIQREADVNAQNEVNFSLRVIKKLNSGIR